MVAPPRPRNTFSPVQYFNDLRSDWDAAKPGRFKRRRSVPSSGAHGDYHARNDPEFLKTMEDVRDMERNDSLVGWLLTLATNLTVRKGIEVQAATGWRKFSANLQAEFDEWCQTPDLCDAAGEQTFYELQSQAHRDAKRDGDCLQLLRDDGTIQHIEAHRLRTPSASRQKNVAHGVVLNESRKRVQYWVTKEDLDPWQPIKLTNDVVRYNTRDEDGHRQVIHYYNAFRKTQTRGMSVFAPVFDLPGMKDDLQFAHLVKSQLNACITFFRELTQDYDGPDEMAPLGPTETRMRSDGRPETIENIAPGLYFKGPKGAKYSAWAPNTPNAEFFAQFKLTIQMIGLALGLPLICVMLDASETNFSGWRGALDVAKMGFEFNQQYACTHQVMPVYKWKVRGFLANNRALEIDSRNPKVKNKFGHICHCPVWPYVNPLQDASTDVLRLRNKLISPIRFHHERNEDPDQVIRETVKFQSRAIQRAMREAEAVRKKFPNETVRWQDFWDNAPPDGVNVSVNATPDAQGGQTKQGAKSDE